MKFNRIFILAVLSTFCFVAMAMLFLNIKFKKNTLPVLGRTSGFGLDNSNLKEKNQQSAQGSTPGISKEQALELAKKSEVAQAFYNLKEGALKDCIQPEVSRPCDSNWVTCIEDAWVVKFRVSEECIKPRNEQLGATLLINNKDGKVISKYPEVDYFLNPQFCRDHSDCRFDDKGDCKNFIYALVENSSATQNPECLCRDSQCVSGR